MTQKDPHAAATKLDIELLMERMGQTDLKMEEWKEEIIEAINAKVTSSEEQTKLYSDVRMEQLYHNLLDAQKTTIQNHEDRLKRVERRLKISHSL